MEKKIGFIYTAVVTALILSWAVLLYTSFKPRETINCTRATEYTHQGRDYKIKESQIVYICDGLLRNM